MGSAMPTPTVGGYRICGRCDEVKFFIGDDTPACDDCLTPKETAVELTAEAERLGLYDDEEFWSAHQGGLGQ